VQKRRVVREVPLAVNGLHNAYAGVRTIYQTSVKGESLALLDAKTGDVRRVDRLPGQPRTAALLPDESRVYIQLSWRHGFIEWDLTQGREVRRVSWPEPDGRDSEWTKCHGIAVAGDELWACSALDDDVKIYSLPDLEPKGRVALGRHPHWIAFGADGETVYVTNMEPDERRGTVSVIDRARRRVLATLEVGRRPKRVVGLVVRR